MAAVCGIVEVVSSRKPDLAGLIDPKLPPPFPSSEGVVRVKCLRKTTF